MKVLFSTSLALILILATNRTESRGIRKKKVSVQVNDYEASGDYFEVTVNSYKQQSFSETTSKKPLEDVSSDDGVTCSQSNITDVLAGYELENQVLVIFKVNVTASERELVL